MAKYLSMIEVVPKFLPIHRKNNEFMLAGKNFI